MDKTEKAFLKQPKVFLCSNVSGKGKRPGKEGHPFSKPVGLGFKSSREATEGIDTDNSAKMNRTIILRRNYLHFIKKYANIPAHVSPCFRVKEGEL